MGKIGPSGVKFALHALKPEVEDAVRLSEAIPIDDIGGFAPLTDVAAMRHAHAPARLFLS